MSQLGAKRDPALGIWSISWAAENTGAQALRLSSVRLPHGQFKSDEMRFTPAIELGPKELTNFEVSVRCDEPQGLVTENAFLIFQTIWRGESWRIFVRVSVVVENDGTPRAKLESVTTQKVGFSGIAS